MLPDAPLDRDDSTPRETGSEMAREGVSQSCWTESKEGLAAAQSEPSRGLLPQPPTTEERRSHFPKNLQRGVSFPSTNNVGE